MREDVQDQNQAGCGLCCMCWLEYNDPICRDDCQRRLEASELKSAPDSAQGDLF